MMSLNNFYVYILDNFNISIEAKRLIDNIIEYAKLNCFSDEELHNYLHYMLDGTIGLEDEEITSVTVEDD